MTRARVNTAQPGPPALLFALLIGAFLLLPLLAVVPVSFTPARVLSMPHGAWSWRHYRELLDDPDWLAAIWLSLRVGVLSSLIATVLAAAFAIGLWMSQPRFAGLLVGFVLLPMVVPPVVSAITLYFLLTSVSAVAGDFGYDTFAGVVLAHAVMTAPFAVVLILVALGQLDRRIDLAARGLGASVATRVAWVIVPNIGFGLVSALLLCFVLSWDEIGVTLFITSVNAITLPRLMWMGLRDNVDPAVASLSVILIVVTVCALLLRLAARRRPA